jgi:hypothetical protein
MGRSPESHKTSLDVLQREDLTLQDLFERMTRTGESTVDTRYEYGNSAKQIIRHVAIRQASLMDIGTVTSRVPALQAIGIRMLERGNACRGLFVQVGDMSRGIQGIHLNQGQDFDGPLTTLVEAVSLEIDWELAEAIPLIRRSLPQHDGVPRLKSARYVERHAPTRVHPSGPRWFEYSPVASRIITVYDHLIDHPRSSRDDRSA